MTNQDILDVFNSVIELTQQENVDKIMKDPVLKQEMMVAFNQMANTINDKEGEEVIPSMSSDAPACFPQEES